MNLAELEESVIELDKAIKSAEEESLSKEFLKVFKAVCETLIAHEERLEAMEISMAFMKTLASKPSQVADCQ